MPTATARRYSQPRPTSIRAEDIPAPADATLIPPDQRPWMLGYCDRCGHRRQLPVGGREGLCAACNAAQTVDIHTGLRIRKVTR